MYNADFFKDPENTLYQPYNDTLIVEVMAANFSQDFRFLHFMMKQVSVL